MSFKQHLSDKYGGSYAFGRHLWHSFLFSAHVYRRYSSTQLARFDRLIFVCRGNICRSPYAEVRARDLGLRAISSGLDTKPGKVANSTAIDAAALRGIDLSPHRAQRLTDLALTEGDLILVMEPEQLNLVRQQVGPKVAVVLLGLYACPTRAYLQDPYGRSLAYFESCFNVIDSALANLQSRLVACKI